MHNENVYFITQLYRDFLLPTILGEDNAEILYWAGKKLSHQYQLTAPTDLADFFKNANLGVLKLLKESHHTYIYELSGSVIQDRLNANSTEFTLEAGMIAETITIATQKAAEATPTIDLKKKIVLITVKADK